MQIRRYYCYILTNPTKTVLYTGITNNLGQRLIEHYLNRGKQSTFAGRYNCYNLIYFEAFNSPEDAIHREKEIKGWTRSKKETLIATYNPEWKFMNSEITDWPPGADAAARP